MFGTMPIVLTAVATLLAVVIGGGITYLTQSRLDDRRASREAARESAAANTELRVAKRLLLEELDTIALHYKSLVDRSQYPQPLSPARGALFLPTTAWEDNKRTLAAALSDDEWGALTPFMHTVSRARVLVLEATPRQPIEADRLIEFENGMELANGLYKMLAGKPAPSLAY
jgi:hypothetical protein